MKKTYMKNMSDTSDIDAGWKNRMRLCVVASIANGTPRPDGFIETLDLRWSYVFLRYRVCTQTTSTETWRMKKTYMKNMSNTRDIDASWKNKNACDCVLSHQ